MTTIWNKKWVKEYQLLTQYAPGVAVVAADPLLTAMRQVKDTVELEHMRAAVKLVEAVLADTLPKIKIGMTEKEVEHVIEAVTDVAQRHKS